jgi:phage-related holin
MALRTVAISYYIANEGFSILENWGALGLPLPKVLKEALAKLRKDEDNESK